MIRYYFEDTNFSFNRRLSVNKWLKTVSINESRQLGDINIIFCSDEYLLNINQKYLKHDYYTDIITFDYCFNNILSGDLFISIDSVLLNSKSYNTEFSNELNRVIVHGILHLIGYDDHTEDDIHTMRNKEDFYLNIYVK